MDDKIKQGPFIKLNENISWGPGDSKTLDLRITKAYQDDYKKHTARYAKSNWDSSLIFRPTKTNENLLIILDPLFLSSVNNNTDGNGKIQDYTPFNITDKGEPRELTFKGPKGQVDPTLVDYTIYNSHFFGNVMAWAIEKAQEARDKQRTL